MSPVSLDLQKRATVLTSHALELLHAEFGAAFDVCVSVRLIGSFARGNASPVSDLDVCLVFDGSHPHVSRLNLPELVRGLVSGIATAFPSEPLARRFSVYWCTLEALRSGTSGEGRFPAYDRGLFRESAAHLGGILIPSDELPQVSLTELREESVQFLLDEVRARLDGLNFFDRVRPPSQDLVKQLGPVLLTKLVLMPIRLLYLMLPESETHPFVSVEECVTVASGHCSKQSWWPLVVAASAWRDQPVTAEPATARASELLSMHARMMYAHVVDRYLNLAQERALDERVAQLAAWKIELLQP